MAKKKSAKTKSAAKSESEPLDFEASLAEVEAIVVKLESGELNLTESLQQYELGVKRLKTCHGLLEAAEQRVTVLAGFDADGNPVTEAVGGSEDDSQSSTTASAGRRRSGGGRATRGRDPETRGGDENEPAEDTPSTSSSEGASPRGRVDDSPELF